MGKWEFAINYWLGYPFKLSLKGSVYRFRWWCNATPEERQAHMEWCEEIVRKMHELADLLQELIETLPKAHPS